ncbi:MAG: hypothetical protein JJT89_06660 [Nitriliruptoraceae bacterium]|nr:hypothetical protein [Nitriliruptoraceae bacterium]
MEHRQHGHASAASAPRMLGPPLRWIAMLGAMALTLALLAPAGTSADAQETGVGGPVILLGFASEAGAGGTGHGPPAEHAAMVQSVLDNVRNGGAGILVIGDGTSVRNYWQGDIGDVVGESVTFVRGASDIATADFDGYKLIGVASSTHQLGGATNGLTNAENEALIGRDLDIAAFINDGGGLIGKTQDRLADPFGYVGPLGDFAPLTSDDGVAQYAAVEVNPAGEALGLTTGGMSGWCCWHDVFDDFPDYMDVLVTHDDQSTAARRAHFGAVAAIGGVDVVVPTGIDLEPQDAEIEVGETHAVTATVEEDEGPAADVEVTFTVTDGPHAGTTGTADTDDDGRARFAYDGSDEGEDTIVASFTDLLERERTSNEVTVTWTAPTPIYPPDPDPDNGATYPPVPEEDEPEPEEEAEVLAEVLEADGEPEAEPATPIAAEPDYTG